MIQTYQGYLQPDGRFVSHELTAIPTNVEVYLVVTDRELTTETKALAQERREAFDEISMSERQEAFENLRGIIPIDFKYSLEDIRNERINKRVLIE